MIRINPTYRYILGTVIEENYISIGLSDLAMNPIGQETMRGPRERALK